MLVIRNKVNKKLKADYDKWKKSQEKKKVFEENRINEEELNNSMQANKDK